MRCRAESLRSTVCRTSCGIVALDQRANARAEATVAAAQRLGAQALADSDLGRSLLLARQGVVLYDTLQTRSNLLAALLRTPAATGVLSGNGERLVTFDLALSEAHRDRATPRWERFFSAVSWLGEREALAVGAAAIAVRLFLASGTVVAVGWVGAQAGGGVLSLALKETFERTRPAFADPLLEASSWSFPSGHAMVSTVVGRSACMAS